MTDDILDYEESIEPFVKYRILALLLEFSPLIVGVLGIMLDNQHLITVGFATGAMLYPLLGWYFFKTNKYNIWDILLATFFGLGIFVILVGFLFYFQKWAGAKEMVITAHLTLMVGFGLAVIHYFIRRMVVKKKEQEFRMSLKILSRYAFLLFLFYALNLDQYMEIVYLEI